MTHNIKKILATICMLLVLTGCTGVRTIDVEYLDTYKAANMFVGYKPKIAVNEFWDEREKTDAVGGSQSMYGSNLVSFRSKESPVTIIENAIIQQLKNSGFEVIKTSGWCLNKEAIPEYLKTDYILGGKLKTFWIKTKPGAFTASVEASVLFDIIIADTENKKILWAGQFKNNRVKEKVLLTNRSIEEPINEALTDSINKIFQNRDIIRVFMHSNKHQKYNKKNLL